MLMMSLAMAVRRICHGKRLGPESSGRRHRPFSAMISNRGEGAHALVSFTAMTFRFLISLLIHFKFHDADGQG